MPMFRETEEFSIFSIMTDDSLTVENKIIRDQVEVDLKKVIEEASCQPKRSVGHANVLRHEFQGNLGSDGG